MGVLSFNGQTLPIIPKEGKSAYFYALDGGYLGTESDFMKDLANLSNPYPIGSIYQSFNLESPGNRFGGTWERIKDVFLLSSGEKFPYGLESSNPGASSVALKVEELPSHSHAMYGGRYSGWSTLLEVYVDQNPDIRIQYTGSSGNSAPHNNMPPYITIYTWKRVG